MNKKEINTQKEDPFDDNSNNIQNNYQILLNVLKETNRLAILNYLMIYEKLSFSDIQDILGDKTKSTVHHHIQKLISAGLVEETLEEHKKHGNIKFYRMKGPLPDFSSIKFDDASITQRNKNYLELFDLGGFYFSFMNQTLQLLVNYVLNTQKKIHELENQNKLNLTSNNDPLLSKIQTIVESTVFGSIPMSRKNYEEFMNGMKKFTMQFLSTMKKDDFQESDKQIYWTMFLGFPYYQIIE